MGHFLWNNTEEKHKYHLANWQLVSQKKEMGGLGIPDLRSLNMALLSSWIFMYHLNSESIWTRIVNFKYKTKKPNIFYCSELGGLPFLERGYLGYASSTFGGSLGSWEWRKGKVLGRSVAGQY
jgi:hypothetical protein